MVTISVVIGVYNEGGLLQETLDSIYAQTFTDYEIVLVDDGSAVPVTVDDPRVRVIRHDVNRGLTRALVDGCAAARGTYIARQDVGDVSLPTRFEKQAALLDANAEVVFVSCHTAFVGPGREPLYVRRARSVAPADILDPRAEHGVNDGPSCHPSVMFRRDVYERAGGYRPAFYFGQDWDLWYRLAALGKFQIVDEVLYEARVMAEGISGPGRDAQLAISRLSLEAMRARLAGASDDEIVARAAAIRKGPRQRGARAKGLYFIGEALRRNGDRRARTYFRQAIAESPLFVRAWVRLLQSFILR